MRLLTWFAETGEEPRRDLWTNLSWVGETFGVTETSEVHALIGAIGEAWNWLEAKGLVVPARWDRARDGAYVVSRRGREVAADSQGAGKLAAIDRALLELHPQMESVRPQLLLGEYDIAVFVGMRSVEDRIRRLAGLESSDVGVKLVTKAFGKTGRLRFPDDEEGEADGVTFLFMGAMGAFKNPTSHRVLAFDDAMLASEASLFANLLHRMLDRVETDLIARFGDSEGRIPWMEHG